MSVPDNFNNRILIIDDNTAIHEDFRKVFRSASEEQKPMQAARRFMFGAAKTQITEPRYVLDSAYQGAEGLELVKKANANGTPYALAFIDVRMPPGMDGIETIKSIWKECPELQIVICTAYSDYSWHDMFQILGSTDSLVILKKPFDNIEVRQIACALAAKWNLNRERIREREELVRARQAAEEASVAKSSFLANMSHEIRTPMNSVIGMIFLMKQTSLSLKQREYATKIDVAANSLLGIINDILDFSKVEAGKIAFERIEFNLDEVLTRLVQLTSTQAQRKALELKITVADNPPKMLIGDPLRLGQVLLNLVSNAIKFTARGEVGVAVKCLSDETARDVSLRFEVRDTGIGIRPENIDQLFKPFGQSDASTTRRYGGTGLGLAISRRFVQLMGSDIDVKSVEGVGSTFGFTVQFTRGLNKHTRSSMMYTLPAGRRVLVIDADAASRAALCALLKELSYVVTAVDSCAGAAHKIVEMSQPGMQRCDLVLMDPSNSGLEWAKGAETLARACGAVRVPPIILIASSAIGDSHIQVEEAGYGGVLIKPITRSALFEAILNLTAKNAPRVPTAIVPVVDPLLRGAHILLIEDNDNNQEIAREVLQLAGCEVSVAANGSEALALLNAATPHAYSAVLTDLQMPGLDGYQTAQAIRASERFGHLPIVAMTADAIAGTREKCLEAGMNAYLTKPINPPEVYEVLAKCLKSQPLGSALRSKFNPAIGGLESTARPLEHYPILDIPAATKLLGGNVRLYERLLTQFNAKYSQAAEAISAASAASDKDIAKRLLHTLKGLAGNLGAFRLMHAAQEWELCFAGESIPGSEPVACEKFRTVLALTVQTIADAVRTMRISSLTPPPSSAVKSSESIPGTSPQSALQSMKRLARALEKNDMEAENLAKQLALELRGTTHARDLNGVCDNIRRFSFPEALADLKRIASQMQCPL